MSKKVLEAIESVVKQNKLKINFEKDANANLRDLKIDSLAAMNIIMQIEEKLNVTLSDEALMSIKTPKDLIDAFEKTQQK